MSHFGASFFSVFLTLLLSYKCEAMRFVMQPKPNIVFIVADDLGHADIGYNNPYMKTPQLDELAKSGVILTQSYVQPLCTASRNAFLTGRYPFRTGLQHLAMFSNKPSCLPTDIKILPQYLKEQGYATHIVGKWHLGFCNWNCTPTFRGFESFYGTYSGAVDYFTHKTLGNPWPGPVSALDFRDNKEPVRDKDGEYATTLYTQRAVQIIDQHNTSRPLFLYLPYTSPHFPLQAPDEYAQRCSDILDKNRRTFCGMVAALDDGVGQVVEALKKSKLYNNTLIVFTTDNGGMVRSSGSNWPLRGDKGTIYEGGTRGTAFVHSPLLKRKGHTSNEMIHAVDWFTTFINLAGGEAPREVDSIDQTDLVMNGGVSQRSEFVYNLDNYTSLTTEGNAAIRVGDYKLIRWSAGTAGGNQWYIPPEYEQDENKTRSHMRSPGVDQHVVRPKRDASTEQASDLKSSPFTHLYNIRFDPEERNNLAEKLPEVVKRLEARLNVYKKQMVKPIWPLPEPEKSNPKNFGNVWSPGWC